MIQLPEGVTANGPFPPDHLDGYCPECRSRCFLLCGKCCGCGADAVPVDPSPEVAARRAAYRGYDPA